VQALQGNTAKHIHKPRLKNTFATHNCQTWLQRTTAKHNFKKQSQSPIAKHNAKSKCKPYANPQLQTTIAKQKKQLRQQLKNNTCAINF